MAGKQSNSKLSLKLFTVLHRSVAALQRPAWQQIQRAGLCPSDFAVLEVLLHKGTLPISSIGSKILLTNGSMTTAIDRLAARGLVERLAHASDKRTRLVALTAQGEQLIKPIFAEHAAVIEAASAGLSLEEKALLIELAKKLGKYADSVEAT